MSDNIVIQDTVTEVIVTDQGASVISVTPTPTVVSVGTQGPPGPAGDSAITGALIAYAVALG